MSNDGGNEDGLNGDWRLRVRDSLMPDIYSRLGVWQLQLAIVHNENNKFKIIRDLRLHGDKTRDTLYDEYWGNCK